MTCPRISTKSHVFALVVLAGMAILLGLGVLSWRWFAGNPYTGHPSDADFIAVFKTHRQEFEKLRGMVTTDEPLRRIFPDSVQPEDYQSRGISEQRIAEYHQLIRALKLHDVSATPNRGIITFTISTEGMLSRGSAKGIEWRREAPDPSTMTTGSLDAFARAEKAARSKNRIGYRRIEEHWLLVFSD